MKKSPNDASGVVWALGVFFFLQCFSSILLTTKAHSSQRWPPKANAGPQKPTAANAGPRRHKGAKRRRCGFFFSFLFIYSYYYETAPMACLSPTPYANVIRGG